MKANPGKINFVNQNAAANVTGVLFENLTKQKVQFIPYRGAGPAMTDLISGTVDLLVVQGAVALPQIRGGKIKALANLSAKRSASMPDIPTADETGVPGLYMSGWFGFFAPKGTPKDVIAKLNAATVEALADPAVQKAVCRLRLDVIARTAEHNGRKPAAFSRKPKSTNGGRLSSLPVSARKRSERRMVLWSMKMDGKTVLITGSTDGVGRYVAAKLAAAGAKVLIHGRDKARAKTLADKKRAPGAAPSRSSIRPTCRRLPVRGSSPKRCSPSTSGSTFSSAMPGSDRGRPSDRPVRMDTNCGLP